MRTARYFLSFAFVASTLSTFASRPDSARITITNPPIKGFFSKYLDAGGIPVRSAMVVDDRALFVARDKINLLLTNMPAARANLVRKGAEMHVIGKDQVTSDLPEYRHHKGVKYQENGVWTDIDERTRGMGGLLSSCGEENLLHLPGDRYGGGSDICLHEFSHAIMNFGLDAALRQKISTTYRRAIAQGLWKDAYAASNAEEYWAELTMWYFGAHGDFLRGTRLPEPGKESLAAYDPIGFALLDDIYSGRLRPQVPVAKAPKKIVPAAKATAAKKPARK